MQAELQFAYAAGKNVLEREESNRDEVEDFLSFECGILSDLSERGQIDQGFSDFLFTSIPTDDQRRRYESKPFTDYTDTSMK